MDLRERLDRSGNSAQNSEGAWRRHDKTLGRKENSGTASQSQQEHEARDPIHRCPFWEMGVCDAVTGVCFGPDSDYCHLFHLHITLIRPLPTYTKHVRDSNTVSCIFYAPLVVSLCLS